MKQLAVVITALALVLAMVSPVAAKGGVVLCRVDIGDKTSEVGHGLDGWGPVEPATHGGYWGGIGSESPPGSCRVIWDSSDDDPSAEMTLDRCQDRGAAKAIRMRHLDGLADDSFDVYVKDVHGSWVLIGGWVGSPGTENWVIDEFVLPNGKELQLDRGKPVEIKLEATGPKWASFGTYGQVAFDWIELIGNGP